MALYCHQPDIHHRDTANISPVISWVSFMHKVFPEATAFFLSMTFLNFCSGSSLWLVDCTSHFRLLQSPAQNLPYFRNLPDPHRQLFTSFLLSFIILDCDGCWKIHKGCVQWLHTSLDTKQELRKGKEGLGFVLFVRGKYGALGNKSQFTFPCSLCTTVTSPLNVHPTAGYRFLGRYACDHYPRYSEGETEVRTPNHTGKTSLWPPGQDSGGLSTESPNPGLVEKSLRGNSTPEGQHPLTHQEAEGPGV